MNWSQRLRAELTSRAEEYARDRGVPAYKSSGGTVLFETPLEGTCHGSFCEESYASILGNPEWKARLEKTHTQRHVLPAAKRAAARELDSCNSSDALLMNLFCYPGFATVRAVGSLVGYDASDAVPVFGWRGHVPLATGATDTTEIDMRVGRVIVESKLTEADFTSKREEVLNSYRDFAEVFDAAMLPTDVAGYRAYQLLRNILCAEAHDCGFSLICDARRPDLIREWWTTARAVRSSALRARLKLVLWQELAAEAPKPLLSCLVSKYGF